jgi:hypothetical protein
LCNTGPGELREYLSDYPAVTFAATSKLTAAIPNAGSPYIDAMIPQWYNVSGPIWQFDSKCRPPSCCCFGSWTNLEGLLGGKRHETGDQQSFWPAHTLFDAG